MTFSDAVRRADLRIEEGKFVEIGVDLEPRSEEVIDAEGLTVLPGLIDGHTHFGIAADDIQSLDDHTSGSRAAAAGGVTTYVNFAPPSANGSMVESIHDQRARADGRTYVDYALHATVGRPQSPIGPQVAELQSKGVTSFKVYTTYRDSPFFTPTWDIYKLMEECGERSLLVMAHSEDDSIIEGATETLRGEGKHSWAYHADARPEIAETAAAATLVQLAAATDCPLYIVHNTVPATIDLIARARAGGQPIFSEVCVHHLSLTDDLYRGLEPGRYIMTPPLRAELTRLGLIERVKSGHVQTSGSDHCGYGLHQRHPEDGLAAVTAGIPGTETLWRVLYTLLAHREGLPVQDVCRLVSEAPARIFGIPNKGTIEVGFDADLVLFDTNATEILDETCLLGHSGYSPWNGMELRGRIRATFCRGLCVYDGVDVIGHPGHGHFLPCSNYVRS